MRGAGSGSRTLVWIEGVPEPVVASRTERTILHEMGQDAAVGSQLLDQALDLAERLVQQTDSGQRRPHRPRPPRATAARVDREARRAATALLTLDSARLLRTPGARGRARADRRRAARRRRRRRDRRGRGVRPGRSGQPRLPRAHRTERLDVRPARARVRLPLVRHPLVPQPRLRGGGESRGGARPRARADGRARRDAGPARGRGLRGCSARARAGSARRSAITRVHDGLPLDAPPFELHAAELRSRSPPAHGSASREPRSCPGATPSPARVPEPTAEQPLTSRPPLLVSGRRSSGDSPVPAGARRATPAVARASTAGAGATRTALRTRRSGPGGHEPADDGLQPETRQSVERRLGREPDHARHGPVHRACEHESNRVAAQPAYDPICGISPRTTPTRCPGFAGL